MLIIKICFCIVLTFLLMFFVLHKYTYRWCCHHYEVLKSLRAKKIKIRVENSKYSCFCLDLPREVVITPVLHPLSCTGFLPQNVKIKERSCSWKGRKQSLKMAAYTRWLSFHISFWGELPKQTFSLIGANGTQKKEGNNYSFL